LPSLQGTTLARQRDWFAGFDAWQSEYFWDDLRTNAQALSAHKDSTIARLGAQLLETLPATLSGANAAAFPRMAAMADDVQALIARLRTATDATIRTAIGQELKKNKRFLDQSADFVATLGETDEGDEEEGEGEDDRRPIRVGKDAAVNALMRAIRGKARAKAMGRALNRETRNGRIIESRAPLRKASIARLCRSVNCTGRRWWSMRRRISHRCSSRAWRSSATPPLKRSLPAAISISGSPPGAAVPMLI
jgi:hypothetical protein